jgi:hypothetical protein
VYAPSSEGDVVAAIILFPAAAILARLAIDARFTIANLGSLMRPDATANSASTAKTAALRNV